MEPSDASSTPVDLAGPRGTGPVWGLASADLNVTLLAWPAGELLPEHVNLELDVLLVVVDGDGTAVVDGRRHPLAAGHALLVEKGTSRSIEAGSAGIRYVSIHRRRGPLQIEGMQ
jgi:mannose-6-phosphate isomerase-like protein (cupin superfamily)